MPMDKVRAGVLKSTLVSCPCLPPTLDDVFLVTLLLLSLSPSFLREGELNWLEFSRAVCGRRCAESSDCRGAAVEASCLV